jgi:hypothetical protein
MVAVPGPDERHQTALVPCQAGEAGAAPSRRRATTPRPRRAPGPTAVRRAAAPLPTLGGDFLSASLALLCREEPLSRAEIGDHADVVAEVADALAAVADRLAHDLDLSDADDASGTSDELAGARDALQVGSTQARRGAALLWARHIELLRAQVEQARGGAAAAAVTPR